jgi:hypothetical protein
VQRKGFLDGGDGTQPLAGGDLIDEERAVMPADG